MKKPESPLPKLLATIPQVCESLNMKRGRVVGLIKSGEIEVVKIGPKCVRVKCDSVHRYVEQLKPDNV